jgi:cell division protein FtsB
MKQGDLVKLTRILGMLGSEHAGERAAAALAANRQVRALNTTWWDLLSPRTRAGQGGEVIRTVYEWGIDHARAAEARMRQLRAENEQLRREVSLLRRRLGVTHRDRAL